MLELIPVEGPVVAFDASGTLSAEDYDRMTAAIDQQLSEHERVGLFADISALDGLSLTALARDLLYSVGKLGELHRLERVAVVTGKPWLRAWAQFAWQLVPSSTVRTFKSTERDSALAWTAELTAEPPQRGLRWLETSRPDAYAFIWNGTITGADADQVFERLERALEARSSVRLLARIERMGGIRPQALFRSSLVRLKALGLHKVERYAIVGRSSWLERYVGLASQLTSIQMRYFPLEREREAWAWIEAEPTTEKHTPPEPTDVARA